MNLIEKFNDIWKITEEDLPTKPRIMTKGNPIFTVLIFIGSFGAGMALLYLLNLWDSILPRIYDGRYDFEGWAASYFIYFFTMVIPIIISNIFYQKTLCPAYGFSSIIAFILSAISYYFIEPHFALYMVISCSLVFLGNAPNQKEYKIKAWHMVYYLILGIIAGYISMLYQIQSWDVWCWLQFIHLHLFIVIIAAVKIRQWGYMYMIGWAFISLLIMIIPNFPIFGLVIPFSKAEIPLTGGYNLIVPPILSWSVLYYFFKIQRKTNVKMNK